MQLSLNLPTTLPADAYDYGLRSSGQTHGVVLTKSHVVKLILDLAGYTVDRDLATFPLLEPACGHGAFLEIAAKRLVQSAHHHKRPLSDLVGSITAYDIDDDHVARSRQATANALQMEGVSSAEATQLAAQWITAGDFLLAPLQRSYSAVVGNPPYIRVENLAPELQIEYRARYTTLFDRADLYIAFIERGLSLLAQDGCLTFICADRWVRNKYGAPLRRLISENYTLACYIDLQHASPFESKVSAYPSIFAVRPGQHSAIVPVLTLLNASPQECADVLRLIQCENGVAEGVTLTNQASSSLGNGPWVLGRSDHLSTLQDLEARFRPLEQQRVTRVGIGVATGNDKVYIVNADARIERDRLVPLVMRADINNGTIRDARRFVINTFSDDGKIVSLTDFPLLSAYLQKHDSAVRKRHVARKNPTNWFRTIDRVYPDLVTTPKLLIPDIAGANEVAFDSGHFHPHHNLYYISSESWDLEVLGALLSSRVALFFVWSYAVKMRGGYLRFQAQYLRRIRVPEPDSISIDLRSRLLKAFADRNFPLLDELALEAFDLPQLPDFAFVDTRT